MASPRFPATPRVPCTGRSVIKHPKGHQQEGQPILDADGARQYKPCEQWAMHGQEVCVAHGGNAPAAIAKAKKIIALGSENAAESLARIANDERVAVETRIKAINSLLDRAGIKTGIDVNLETPGWQQVLGKMFGVPTAEEEAEEAEPSTQDDPHAPRDARDVEIRKRVAALNNPANLAEPAAEAPPAKPRRKAAPATPAAAPQKAAPRKAAKAAPKAKPAVEPYKW